MPTLSKRGILDHTDKNLLARHFLDQIHTYTNVTSIYFGNQSGGLIDAGREGVDGALYIIETENFTHGLFSKYAAGSDDEVYGSLLHSLPAFDARTRPWYTMATTPGKSAWSTPYILFTGQDMAISISQPVVGADGVPLGVVAVDIFLSQLSNFLAEVAAQDDFQIYIIERTGHLVASSKKHKTIDVTSTGKEPSRVMLSECTSPLVRAAGTALVSEYGDLSAITSRGNFEFTHNNRRHQVYAAPVSTTNSDLDWLIVSVLPESSFLGQIEKAEQATWYLIFAIFSLVSLTGSYLVYRVTKPITRLNLLAQQMARGEFSALHSSRIREFGRLSRSFTQMAEKIELMINGLSREIDKRKHAESIVEIERSNFQSFLNTMDDLLFVLDDRGIILWHNHSVQEKLNYSSDELLGRNVLLLHPEEFRKEAAETVTAMLAGEKEFCPLPLLTKDGDYLPVETRITLGKWNEKRVVFGVTKDLSRIKASEEKFSKAFHISPALMAINERETGNFVEVNEAFLKVLGFSKTEVIGKTTEELNIIADPKKMKAARDIIARGGPLRDHEVDVWTKDGQKRQGIFSAESLRLQNGNFLLTVMTDVTAYRQMQEQLVQKEKFAAIGQLSAGIAHHFNNILAGIVGNVELLQTSRLFTRSEHIQLETVLSLGMRAAGLVTQILDFSQKSMRSMETVDLADYVREEVEKLQQASGEGPRLAVDVAPGEYPFRVDINQIQQLLANLLSNAIKASPLNGVIEVSLVSVRTNSDAVCSICRQEIIGDYYKLSIRDMGDGIPEDVLPRIFEPFFSTRAVGQGSGLGLAQASGIIAQYGGHIQVESSLGKGSTFTVFLPIAQQS